jgi:hypothetical protein
MSESTIRRQLLVLLRGGNAHLTLDETIESFPMDRVNERFPNGEKSTWEVLEHMRLTQEDIIDFMCNPDYREKEWPRDSWPPPGTIATPADWRATVDGLHDGIRRVEAMLEDESFDLYSEIPWGVGQNRLREVLIIADHNSHHLGEISIMRQAMSTWPKSARERETEYAQRRSSR